MPDREKVIKAIEIHLDLNSDCEGCAYDNGEECFKKMVADALTLLREQEPVEPKWTDFEDSFTGEKIKVYQCGNCGSYLFSDSLYCRRCGRKVKCDSD